MCSYSGLLHAFEMTTITPSYLFSNQKKKKKGNL